MADHHYVSKFYYKNFAFNPERSLVYSMNNDGRISSRPKSIRKISFEKDYNTQEQEQEQNRLETIYARILRDFIETPNSDDLNLARDFLDFVSFMLGNNIYIRKKIMEGFSKLELQIEGFPVDHDISIDREHKGKFDWSEAFIDAVFEEFHSWKFVRHDTTNGEKVFITSDDPVNIFNPENLWIPAQANIIWADPKVTNFGDEIPISDGRMSREMQVQMRLESISFQKDVVMFFPITPSSCLIGFSDSNRHARFIKRPIRVINAVSFINFTTLCLCNKAVYSHSEDRLKETNTNKHNFIDYCESHGRIPTFDFGIG